MTTATATKIFADRIGRIEVSATMAITAAALKLKSEGVDLADFARASLTFRLRDTSRMRLSRRSRRTYSLYNVAGIPEVRKAVCGSPCRDFGSSYTPDECVFTTGGKLALFNAIQVLVDQW